MGNIELIVEGRKFIVQVEEEDSFRTITYSKFPTPAELLMDKEREKKVGEDDDVEHNSNEVEALADMEPEKGRNLPKWMLRRHYIGNTNRQLQAVGVQNINEARADSLSSTSGFTSSVMGSEMLKDSFNEDLKSAQADGCINDLGLKESNMVTTVNKEFNENTQIIEEELAVNHTEAYENGPQRDLFLGQSGAYSSCK